MLLQKHLQYKLYIFDLGNVVLDNVDVVPSISRELGVPQEEFGSFYDTYLARLMVGTLTSRDFWAEYTSVSGTRVDEDLLGTCFTPVENKEMTALLSTLRELGGRVVCGTNTYESHFLYLETCGIFNCFDKVYASHQMGIAKPDAEFFHSILEAEGIEADDAFFADDLVENVESATSIGIHAVLFRAGDSITPDLL
ncbi:MAG: HAD-IA family hydrolase [Spirochaetales bacterium]|nr:HAD-IA family hydrolase [Spirochaetales bacterium]